MESGLIKEGFYKFKVLRKQKLSDGYKQEV